MAIESKNVKIISCYLGTRRAARHFTKSIFYMLKVLWEKEQMIDHEIDMDTIIIYNRLNEEESARIEDQDSYKKAEHLLYSFNGQKTKNGKCFVVARENRGISFGAFDFAFHEFKKKYDYWLFIEDDQIIVRDGVMRQCIKQLMMPSFNNLQCGYVSIAGIHIDNTMYCPGEGYLTHAYGACGCTSTYVLENVFKNNISEIVGRSCLPHDPRDSATMESHSLLGEIPFTNMILNFGYGLEKIQMEKILISWGDSFVRNELYDDLFIFYPNLIFKEKMRIFSEFVFSENHYPLFNFHAEKGYQKRKADIIFTNLKNNTFLYSTNVIFDLGHGDFWSELFININEIDEIMVEIYVDHRVVLRETYKYNKDDDKINKMTREEDDTHDEILFL